MNPASRLTSLLRRVARRRSEGRNDQQLRFFLLREDGTVTHDVARLAEDDLLIACHNSQAERAGPHAMP